MQRRRSPPHTFEESLAAEKAKLEAQVTKLKPGPQMDALRKKDTALRNCLPYERVADLFGTSTAKVRLEVRPPQIGSARKQGAFVQCGRRNSGSSFQREALAGAVRSDMVIRAAGTISRRLSHSGGDASFTSSVASRPQLCFFPIARLGSCFRPAACRFSLTRSARLPCRNVARGQ
jgi:hypothetical protein